MARTLARPDTSHFGVATGAYVVERDDWPAAIGGRLRQLHVSGIEADGTHRPTTQADLELYAPLLRRCGDVPSLLEAELVEERA